MAQPNDETDEEDFRRDYEQRYGRTGRPWEAYSPAYRSAWERITGEEKGRRAA